MKTILTVAQITIAGLLVLFILLQQRGTALGSGFGGGSEGLYTNRRGVEKNLYWASIVCAIIFIVLALLDLIIA